MEPSAVRGPDARGVLLAWVPAAAYMALIWFISSLEAPTFPTSLFPLRDKGVHFVEYGVLGFLLAHACLRTFARLPTHRVALFAVLFGVLWGLFDEIHQAFVPGRSADALDLVADSIGVLLGTLARVALRWLKARVSSTSPPATPSAKARS